MQSNYTTKTQEALGAAVRQAGANGNPQVEPAHLMQALLAQSDGIAVALLQAVGADLAGLTAATDAAVAALPSAAGASVSSPTLANPTYRVLTAAGDLAKDRGDDFISTEHLLIGLAKEGPGAALLTRFGATADALVEALSRVRGASRVTSADPEGTFQARSSEIGAQLQAGFGSLVGQGLSDVRVRGAWAPRALRCAQAGAIRTGRGSPRAARRLR